MNALQLVKSIALDLMRRSSLENPQTPLSYPAEWLIDAFTGGRSDSGMRVSPMTALQVSTVYACVMRIASSVATLPLNVYEHINAKDLRAGKRLAVEHDIFDMLHSAPNDEMTSRTMRMTTQAHMLLWGNGFAEIQRDNGGRPVALWPRNPAMTKPVRRNGRLLYETTEGANGGPASPRDILSENMLHVPGLAIDGRVGQEVVYLARQSFGLAMAAEKFGNKLFANYGRPGGVLEHPGELTDEARKAIKDSWAQAQGGENIHTVPLLEEGLVWKDVANKPNEAQFLETRQFQRAEICSIFGVPPHMIGDPDKQNRANTEQLGLEFVTFTLAPWLVAWEQELKRKLFPKLGRSANKYFAMFDTRRLMMPDANSRKGFYIAGKQWGFLSTNDIRELENLNPIDDPDADALWIPLNMVQAGAQTTISGDQDISGRYVKAFSRIFSDGFKRITGRDEPNAEDFRRVFLPILASLADLITRSFEAEDELEPEDVQPAYLQFLVEYIDGMRARLPQWKAANGESDLVADGELAKAAKAIRGEIFRSIQVEKQRREAGDNEN